jgi:hypothetical protein
VPSEDAQLRSSRSEIAMHHVTRHTPPIHNILSIAPPLSISQKALGTLPEDGNAMPKHVGGKSNPITGLDRPIGFQEVEAPR